ncbi:hypothetical protein SBD_5904 [Streptomyces bottropensis ATCC 25435]|uniref:Uncharacterized protein n=1 Tax=Streptomyces bottropensis ATCC 25435 TaxID=1054862 RepID=M3FL74_9ACTN|nr:hypothetical protein SBD_5904 [Streptomyces bottropensis ATCC 25435]
MATAGSPVIRGFFLGGPARTRNLHGLRAGGSGRAGLPSVGSDLARVSPGASHVVGRAQKSPSPARATRRTGPSRAFDRL